MSSTEASKLYMKCVLNSFKEIDEPERRVRLLAGQAGERFRNE
jgi:hypothetical protein